jgi:triphosphoribosyl-dephospho-CoA synthase
VTTATALDVGALSELACLLEVSAPKPGNVCPGRHFADVCYEDFLVSAIAIRNPMAGAASRPLGATIRLAVEATTNWTATNTNLGIVLLLAPLARATALESDVDRLRDSLRRVLDATTVADARETYAAIRRASPGGLGHADEQDVSEDPTVTLTEAMQLAADRDSIAREYVTVFATTFEVAVPALKRGRAEGLSWDDSIVETFLTVLAGDPDTHIARRRGAALAAEVSRGARDVLAAGGVRSAAGRRAIEEFDRTLRDERHRANPGTTADLMAAAIFVVLAGGGWHGQGGRDAAAR